MLGSSGVAITELALQRAQELRGELGHPEDWGLRVAGKGGGCSGFMYDTACCAPGGEEGDRVVRADGRDLYIDRKSYLFLIGLEVD